MFRRLCLASCLLLTLASCRSPVPVWNDDGETMTDLRSLRHRGRQSLQLTPGVRLYADEIRYTDKRKRSGEALGRVFLDVGPSARYEWMIKYGYAGRAVFDKTRSYVSLADRPMLERDYLTQIGTEPYTTIDVRWTSRMADVVVRGPTRTDFAKSHPVPPGAVFRAVPVSPMPARKTVTQTTILKR
jgi:hypothetical protein